MACGVGCAGLQRVRKSSTLGGSTLVPKEGIIPFALQSNYWSAKDLSPVLRFVVHAACIQVTLLMLSSILLLNEW